MKQFIKKAGLAALTATMLAASGLATMAADYTIRATANSNENDEDYDGLVVSKTTLKRPQTAKLPLNFSSAHSFAQRALSACRVSLTDQLMFTFQRLAVPPVRSHTFRFSTCLT